MVFQLRQCLRSCNEDFQAVRVSLTRGREITNRILMIAKELMRQRAVEINARCIGRLLYCFVESFNRFQGNRMTNLSIRIGRGRPSIDCKLQGDN